MKNLRPRLGILIALVAPASCAVYTSGLITDEGSTLGPGATGGKGGSGSATASGAVGSYGGSGSSSGGGQGGTGGVGASSASSGGKRAGGGGQGASTSGGQGGRSSGGGSGNSGGTPAASGSGGDSASGGNAGSGGSSGGTGSGGASKGGSGGVPANGGKGGASGGAASSGAGGKGGTAGSGGLSQAGGVAGSGYDLVDDFEDGDSQIQVANGRNGYWFTYNDGTATGVIVPDTQKVPPDVLEPEVTVGPQGENTPALHVKVDSGFTSWGAGLGFNFSQASGARTVYDLTPYQGIVFYARAVGATSLHLELLTEATQEGTDGKCGVPAVVPSASAKCGDNFAAIFPVTTDWTRISIKFSDFPLARAGWGAAISAADFNQALAIQIRGNKAQAYEVWIDDVSLQYAP